MIDAFYQAILDHPPKLAMIVKHSIKPQALQGFDQFFIKHSEKSAKRDVIISPDVSTCEDCYQEIMDPPFNPVLLSQTKNKGAKSHPLDYPFHPNLPRNNHKNPPIYPCPTKFILTLCESVAKVPSTVFWQRCRQGAWHHLIRYHLFILFLMVPGTFLWHLLPLTICKLYGTI
jgi:hypothetical protein